MHDWNKGFVANSANVRYERLAKDIDKAMKFMKACGADFEAMRTTEFFSAHEALVLDYERPMTRIDSRTGNLYDTSGHFVWVGERTRDLDGAHIDFVASVRNPVGVKVSANADTDDLLRIIDKVDPEREPGRLTFITRMGAGRIREALPTIVEKVTASGASVTWVCDPMHGNTYESASGYKTRDFDDVVDEVEGFFEVHRALGTVPGRHPRRAHRQRRHRVPRRLGEDPRRRPQPALRVGVRPAAEPPAEPRAGVPRRRDAQPGLTRCAPTSSPTP